MRSIVERQYTISEDEIHEAVLQYLESHGKQIPTPDDDYEIKVDAGPAQITVRWTYSDMPTDY